MFNIVSLFTQVLSNENVILSALCVPPSDYQRNLTDVNEAFKSAPLGPGVVAAIWQLVLALIFKMLITIFTFGIKASKQQGKTMEITIMLFSL